MNRRQLVHLSFALFLLLSLKNPSVTEAQGVAGVRQPSGATIIVAPAPYRFRRIPQPTVQLGHNWGINAIPNREYLPVDTTNKHYRGGRVEENADDQRGIPTTRSLFSEPKEVGPKVIKNPYVKTKPNKTGRATADDPAVEETD